MRLDDGRLDRLRLRLWLGTPAEVPRPEAARDAAERGWLHSLRGEPSRAEACFDEALRRRPRDARALAWRGEAALLRGDLAGARRCLDGSIAADARLGWPLAYRAALWVRTPDGARARADVAALRARMPRSPLGFALEAVLRQHDDDGGAVRAWLDRALERGRPLWLRGLRAALLARLDAPSHEEAQRLYDELGAALACEDSALLRLARAHLHQLGRPLEAYADLRRAVALAPRDPAVLGDAARCYAGWEDHPRAAALLDRAVARAPEDPVLRLERARLLPALGREEQAVGDAAAAARGLAWLADAREVLARALLAAGRLRDCERLVSGEGWTPHARLLFTGIARCRARRPREAAPLFARARAAAPDEAARRRAALYQRTAETMARAPRGPRAGGRELLSCGFGFCPPYQVTVGAIHALLRADVIFNNIVGGDTDETLLYLLLFPAKIRTLELGSPESGRRLVRGVLRGFALGPRVGVVARGQHLLLGGFARHLRAAADREGIRCRYHESITGVEVSAAAVPRELAAAGGSLQVRLHGRVEAVDPGLPLYLYEPEYAPPSARARLRALYPSGQACLRFTLSPDHLLHPLRASLSELAPGASGPHGSVFVPAVQRPRRSKTSKASAGEKSGSPEAGRKSSPSAPTRTSSTSR